MRNITKLIISIASLFIGVTTIHFLVIYKNLTQMVLIMSLSGTIILGVGLYVYEWMIKLEKEVNELGRAIDRVLDYAREVEKKVDGIRTTRKSKV